MKKVLWFPVMIIAIPFDIVLWNLVFGLAYGFRTPKQCFDDHWKQWCDLNTSSKIKEVA